MCESRVRANELRDEQTWEGNALWSPAGTSHQTCPGSAPSTRGCDAASHYLEKDIRVACVLCVHECIAGKWINVAFSKESACILVLDVDGD